MAVIFRGLRSKLPVTIRTVGFGSEVDGAALARVLAISAAVERAAIMIKRELTTFERFSVRNNQASRYQMR